MVTLIIESKTGNGRYREEEVLCPDCNIPVPMTGFCSRGWMIGTCRGCGEEIVADRRDRRCPNCHFRTSNVCVDTESGEMVFWCDRCGHREVTTPSPPAEVWKQEEPEPFTMDCPHCQKSTGFQIDPDLPIRDSFFCEHCRKPIEFICGVI